MYQPKSKSTASRYCPLWAFPSEFVLKVFETRLLGRSFHTLIKMFCSPLQLMWDLTIHPSLGSSVLAGTPPGVHPPSGPNVLAGKPPNVHPQLSVLVGTPPGVWLWYHFSPSKPTTSRYCHLWTFLSRLALKVFKTRRLGRGFHTFIKKYSFPSPTDVGSHSLSGFPISYKSTPHYLP